VRDKTIAAGYDGGRIALVVEDPSLRRELEHALRSLGHRLDFTLNRDVVTVGPPAFVRLLARTLALGDEELARLLADGVADARDAKKMLDKRLPLEVRVAEYLKEKQGAVSVVSGLLGGIAKFFVAT